MDKFPLMQGCFSVGELITEQEALYTWFEARCRLPGRGPLVRLGGGRPGRGAAGRSGALWGPGHNPAAVFRPADSPSRKAAAGEIRPAHPPEPEDWTPLERSAVRLRSPWLRGSCTLCRASLSGRSRGGRAGGAL